MKNSFKPIYLQDAKRHVEWLYKRLKDSKRENFDEIKEVSKSSSIVSKLINLFKKIF